MLGADSGISNREAGRICADLDAVSEAHITDALQRLRAGRTTIIIARARGGRFADLFARWVAGAA